METITFNDIWTLLCPQGEYKRREEACRRLWQSLEPDRQREIFYCLQSQKQRSEFIKPNPYFAIEDTALGKAARPSFKAEPTNYNGKALPDEAMVIARYNGVGGLYTAREARLFGMEIIKDFEP